MKISKDFEGGNIIVDKIEGNNVALRCDLTGTSANWFYWCFKVENAKGQVVTFTFNNDVIGYFGPAVSKDNVTYEFLNDEFSTNYRSFTYKFETDDPVYFCHDIAYRTKRFNDFVDKNNLKLETLCISNRNSVIPMLKVGNGKKIILITSRHHACESSGTYVLEGVIDYLKDNLPSDYTLVAIPFVDYDGVVLGEQGKDRIPHDHNRDYLSEPLYNEVKAIEDFVKNNNIECAFDFHSPWHIGNENNQLFVVTPLKCQEKVDDFSDILVKNNTGNTLPYFKENNYKANFGWNIAEQPTFFYYVINNSNCKISFSFETTYFGDQTFIFAVDKAITFGRNFGKTIIDYLNTK